MAVTVKVKKIVRTRSIVGKDGRQLTVTTFTTDDGDLMETFSQDIKEGESYEGDITENEYGKRFRKTPASKGSAKGTLAKADPDTMLIAYAKDIVVAFIGAGVLTDEAKAEIAWQRFTKLARAMYTGEPIAAGQPVPAENNYPPKGPHERLRIPVDTLRQFLAQCKEQGIAPAEVKAEMEKLADTMDFEEIAQSSPGDILEIVARKLGIE